MTKRFSFLLLIAVLAVGLAACGDKKDDANSEGTADGTNNTGTTDTGKDEASGGTDSKGDADKNVQVDNDLTLGMTMDEFEKAFNENAKKKGLSYEIEDYEFLEGNNVRTATIQLKSDLLLSVLEMPDSEEVKAVKLEIESIEKKEETNKLIQTIIESVAPDLSDDELERVQKEIGTADPDTIEAPARNDSESYYGDVHYILSYKEADLLEFIAANREDTQFAAE